MEEKLKGYMFRYSHPDIRVCIRAASYYDACAVFADEFGLDLLIRNLEEFYKSATTI